jgi:hypothetical protein
MTKKGRSPAQRNDRDRPFLCGLLAHFEAKTREGWLPHRGFDVVSAWVHKLRQAIEKVAQ